MLLPAIWYIVLGAATLFGVQFALKWRKTSNAPWYFWVLAILSYLTFIVGVPMVYTLAGEFQKKPVLFVGLAVGIILVIFIALARTSLVMAQKKLAARG